MARGDGAVDPESRNSATHKRCESTSVEPRYPDRLDARLLRIGSVCLIVSAMASLDTTIVAVAQRTFVVEFQSSQAVVAWTMAAYILGLATVTPMTGWAADRFGTKRLFIGSVLAFTLGSLLCAMAPNILLLIIFRALQGVGGGTLTPLMLTIVTRAAGPKRLGRLLGLAAIPMVLAPICGPILGGWIIRTYGWEWIFLINVPVGLIAVVFAAFIFPRDDPAPSETFDFIGVLLLTPGVATLLLGLSEMPARGTVADRHVLIPMIVGLVLIIVFVWHAWYRAEHPLLDFRLLTKRTVGLANLAMLIYVLAGAGAGLVLPSYFQQLLHHSPMQAGLDMIPLGLGAMLTMPVAGILMDRFGPGKIVLVGISLAVTGLSILAYGVITQVEYSPTLLAAMLLTGMGSGCTMLPLPGAAVQTLAQHQIARGSTLVSINQLMASSIGASVMSVILTSQFNRSENISAATKMTVLQQQEAESGVPIDPSAIPLPAVAPDFLDNVQADLSHAYAVVFAVAAVLIALTFVPAVFLLRKPVALPPNKLTATPSRSPTMQILAGEAEPHGGRSPRASSLEE